MKKFVSVIFLTFMFSTIAQAAPRCMQEGTYTWVCTGFTGICNGGDFELNLLPDGSLKYLCGSSKTIGTALPKDKELLIPTQTLSQIQKLRLSLKKPVIQSK